MIGPMNPDSAENLANKHEKGGFANFGHWKETKIGLMMANDFKLNFLFQFSYRIRVFLLFNTNLWFS